MSRVRLIWIAAVVSAACGDSPTAPAGPCDGADPAPECGVACTGDGDCAAGFHCTPEGACTADCTADGAGCGDGYACDDRGNCVTDPGGDDPGCPSVAVGLEPIIPTVLILLDQSGSMDEDFNGPTRWEAVTEALVDPDDGIIARLAKQVIFGATLYSSENGNAGGTCPNLESVPLAIDNYDAIAQLINGNEPFEDTPTAESIDAVVPAFPAPDPERPAPRILLLATDGNPDNCADPDAHDRASQIMSETAVQNAYANQIETIVLSVGEDTAQDHLQNLADAGKGKPIGAGSETFYVATDPDELVAAFEQIIGGVRSCQLTLDGAVRDSDAEDGVVELNGTPLEYGTDWTLVDPSTMELLGDACDTFLDDPEVVLTAEFPCGAIVL
jgi:hypothetical protein